MMRRVSYHVVCFAVLHTGCILTVFPQEPEFQVHRSENKVILSGQVYYIHVVKERESLDGICEAYNVTRKVIVSENPDVMAGLRVGMVLKIPAEPVVNESLESRDTADYFYHEIRPGETLSFLSRKYGIDVIEIENLNPGVDYSELQIGHKIKIPRRKEPGEQGFGVEDFIYHYVNQGQTLYRLSRLYNVSIEQIKELNPELRWGELKYDRYIKIPRPADTIQFQQAGVNEFLKDTLAWDSTYRSADTVGVPFWSEIDTGKIRPQPVPGSIRVAILLPLELHREEIRDTVMQEESEGEEEALIPEGEEEERMTVDPRLVPYFEFYQGILIALDSLRKEGIPVTLFVYDTDRSRRRTREILAQRGMEDMDLFIGPVNFWNLEVVAEFAREKHIPLIAPFTTDEQIVKYNPYVIQMTPYYEIEFRSWAEYLSDNYEKTLILVHSGDSLESRKIEFLKNEIYRRISEKADLADVIFKDVIFNDSVTRDMSQVLNQEEENLVIIPSDNEAYVSTVISPLYYLLGDFDIEVSGMPQWSSFRNIDLEYFHDLNTSYYTSFYMDYKDPRLMNFITRFRDVYGTEPYKVRPRGYNLSVYGFDIMYNFVSAFSEYGKSLIYYAEDMESHPLLGPYKLQRINDFGGHVNSYISIVRYHPDLNIDKIELEDRPNQYRYRRYFRLFRGE